MPTWSLTPVWAYPSLPSRQGQKLGYHRISCSGLCFQCLLCSVVVVSPRFLVERRRIPWPVQCCHLSPHSPLVVSVAALHLSSKVLMRAGWDRRWWRWCQRDEHEIMGDRWEYWQTQIFVVLLRCHSHLQSQQPCLVNILQGHYTPVHCFQNSHERVILSSRMVYHDELEHWGWVLCCFLISLFRVSFLPFLPQDDPLCCSQPTLWSILPFRSFLGPIVLVAELTCQPMLSLLLRARHESVKPDDSHSQPLLSSAPWMCVMEEGQISCQSSSLHQN